jgi:hypothetical protein
MRDRRRSSPHGGAPPLVRLPGVKSLSTGSSAHGLQHREGEMGGVKNSSGKGVAERCRRMDKDRERPKPSDVLLLAFPLRKSCLLSFPLRRDTIPQ